MKNDILENITKSIQEKLGKENSALISDDLGLLITENTKAFNESVSKDNEITTLKDRNEKLVIANGNLLQQVPKLDSYNHHEEPTKEESKKKFNFKDAFDDKGHFKA